MSARLTAGITLPRDMCESARTIKGQALTVANGLAIMCRPKCNRNSLPVWTEVGAETPMRTAKNDAPLVQFRHGQRGATGAWLLIILLAAMLLWWFMPLRQELAKPQPITQVSPVAVAARGSLADDEQNNIAVFKAASPTTVNITTLDATRNFFSLNVTEVPRGTGTGFIWDDRGHIVTNFHVIQGSNAARVTLSDHTTWNATLVGVFPDRDLAVLRIDAPKEKLKPISVGTSRDLQVGQKVYAIGNPFGLDQTLTTGIVSALNREIESVTQRTIRGVIQTDAAINPGNSGDRCWIRQAD